MMNTVDRAGRAERVEQARQASHVAAAKLDEAAEAIAAKLGADAGDVVALGGAIVVRGDAIERLAAL